jgi:hypothetical protein
MRSHHSSRVLVGLCLAVFSFALPALADDTHDTVVAPKTVSVSVKGGWHVNKDYPWALVAGDKKLDKTHFTLTETSASLSDAPSGPVTLKGAVCSGDQCKPFQETLVVP